MKIVKLVGCAGIVTLGLTLAAGSAGAAKRDVIAEANAICAANPADPNLAAACALLFDTNGGQVIGNGCVAPFDAVDNGFVDYLLRNCDRNEQALLRKASSAVLSLNDLVNKGKVGQASTAATDLCTYAASYMTLEGAGKLVAASGVDLAADAQDIASALGFPCF